VCVCVCVFCVLCVCVFCVCVCAKTEVRFEKLIVPQPVKKFPYFVEAGGSLLHLQQHATCPYPEPDQHK
jgi:hypothetical protein